MFPSRNKLDGGNKTWYMPQERAAEIFVVQLLPCQPLALIPVNGQNPEIGGKNRTEKWLQRATLGSPGGDPSQWKFFLVDYLGHSASVLRDSAVYARK
jgi:hypothetical protein